MSLQQLNLGQGIASAGMTLSQYKVSPPAPKEFEKAIPEDLGVLIAEDLPPFLSEWHQGPAALFTRGSPKCLWKPCVGIVGTRGASNYGLSVAAQFSEALARFGVAIVSGGAVGIDAAAHKGALKAKGATVAVLAGGLDTTYPAGHRGMFDDMIEDGGCLISQFPIGLTARRESFLQRNIIIAALSHALIVIESPHKSGSLSTAHAALNLGKTVFVVPGQIGLRGFEGSHSLIKNGATLLDDPSQVSKHLGLGELNTIASSPKENSLGAKILEILQLGSQFPETIAEKASEPLDKILAELTDMELDGLVAKDGPKVMKR